MKKLFPVLLCLLFSITTFGQDDGRLIKIPVVFHILYGDQLPDNGINEGSIKNGNSTMYLPKEKIEAELADLNADYQNLNTDLSIVRDEYKKVIGNPKIHFFLSEIKYVPIDKKEFARPKNNTDLLIKKSQAVNPRKNLNVYISIIKVKGKLSSGVTPAKSRKYYGDGYDVVNLNFQWVGLKYSLLTHEVGHWLDLRHTWNEEQFEDGIDDIPLQITYTDLHCVLCPDNVPDQLREKWRNKGFKQANFNNFMDYSGCRAMFSIKQAQHMREFVKVHRSEIWNNQ